MNKICKINKEFIKGNGIGIIDIVEKLNESIVVINKLIIEVKKNNDCIIKILNRQGG